MAPVSNRPTNLQAPADKCLKKCGTTIELINRQIKNRCLIKINNDTSNSFFLALQATLVYATGGLTDQRFYDYRNSIDPQMNGRLQREMLELKKAVGAPEQDEVYDVKVWLPKVIDYWNNNNTGGHKFHAFVFKPNCESNYFLI